jgi:hypothetical protein
VRQGQRANDLKVSHIEIKLIHTQKEYRAALAEVDP